MRHLKYLADLDLRSVPEPVLIAVYESLSAELFRRGSEVSESVLLNKRFLRRNKTVAGKLTTGQAQVSFDALEQQDWSDIFHGGDPTPKYYVYAHMTTGAKSSSHRGNLMPFGLKKMPFYIGKGTGNRAFDLNRNQGHAALLREQFSFGRKVSSVVKVLRDGLTEAQAYELESKLIFFFGTKYEIGRPGVLVNLDIPKRPSWCEVTRPRENR